MFGGQITVRPPRGLAKRTLYMWRITGTRAEDAIRAVRPYLRVKADQADIALHFQESMRAYVQSGRKLTEPETARRMGLMDQIKALKWRTFDV